MEDGEPEFLIESLWILEDSSRLCIFEVNYVDFISGRTAQILIQTLVPRAI